MDVKPSPCTAVLHSISTAYRSDCVLTELFICYILKQWQFLEKATGPFRCVAKGHGETGILLVCEQTDWVRFGRETGRWVTCGRRAQERGCLTSQSLGRKQEVWQVVGRKSCWISQRHRPALHSYRHPKLTACARVPSRPSCWLSWSQLTITPWDFGLLLFLQVCR